MAKICIVCHGIGVIWSEAHQKYIQCYNCKGRGRK